MVRKKKDPMAERMERQRKSQSGIGEPGQLPRFVEDFWFLSTPSCCFLICCLSKLKRARPSGRLRLSLAVNAEKKFVSTVSSSTLFSSSSSSQSSSLSSSHSSSHSSSQSSLQSSLSSSDSTTSLKQGISTASDGMRTPTNPFTSSSTKYPAKGGLSADCSSHPSRDNFLVSVQRNTFSAFIW